MNTFRHFRQYLNSFYKENVLDKICTQNQNTHFMFNNFFFENRAVYDIMSKDMESNEPQMTSQYGAYELHTA